MRGTLSLSNVCVCVHVCASVREALSLSLSNVCACVHVCASVREALSLSCVCVHTHDMGHDHHHQIVCTGTPSLHAFSLLPFPTGTL